MRFTYDDEVDILMVYLSDAKIDHSERLGSGPVIDYAADGSIVSLEFMGASKLYPLKELRKHPANYEEPISVRRCGRGLHPQGTADGHPARAPARPEDRPQLDHHGCRASRVPREPPARGPRLCRRRRTCARSHDHTTGTEDGAKLRKGCSFGE